MAKKENDKKFFSHLVVLLCHCKLKGPERASQSLTGPVENFQQVVENLWIILHIIFIITLPGFCYNISVGRPAIRPGRNHNDKI